MKCTNRQWRTINAGFFSTGGAVCPAFFVRNPGHAECLFLDARVNPAMCPQKIIRESQFSTLVFDPTYWKLHLNSGTQLPVLRKAGPDLLLIKNSRCLMEGPMALRTRADTGKELRHPASGQITLTLEHQPGDEIIGELKDLSPSGFRVCLNCAALISGQLARIRYAHKEKKVRIVWVRKLQRGIESGLLLQEAYLLRQALAGDGQAFADLISPHVHSLRCTVCSILRNPADAEEVLQESMLKVAQHLDQFRPGLEFRPWFAQIATNEALKRLKRNRRHDHDPLDLGE